MAGEDILDFKKGELIISKGTEAKRAFMILEGKVRVFLEEEGKVVELATLQEDEIFGESAIFSGGIYGASVEALEDCELLEITKESLNTMLRDINPTLRAMFLMLMTRLKTTNEALLKSETRTFMDVALI